MSGFVFIMVVSPCSRLWIIISMWVCKRNMRRFECVARCFGLFVVNNSVIIDRVSMLKDGDRAPLVKGRNADVLVSRERVGRGSCLFWGPRD